MALTRSPTMTPALQAIDVHKEYDGVTALDGVSLSVTEGECVALVGESGSGKTTLLRCFNRMVAPDRGRVLLGGRDASTVDPIALRRRTGYVQQEGGLLPHWTVTRNTQLVPWLLRLPDAVARADRVLELVGLPPQQYGGRWPADLSGGQRQRVAIARALAPDPTVVLLDEPFGALDAITRSDLQQAFLDLRTRLHLTALLVTHDLAEAIRLADRIAVMRSGRLEQVAAPRDLVESPETPYVRRLLERADVK
jgi:osmoprotectant transport system ATP-binding protein